MQSFGSHSFLHRSTAENSTQPSINLQLIKTGQIHVPLSGRMECRQFPPKAPVKVPPRKRARRPPGSADLLREGWESAELRVEERRGDDPLPPCDNESLAAWLRKETLIGRDKMR